MEVPVAVVDTARGMLAPHGMKGGRWWARDPAKGHGSTGCGRGGGWRGGV